IDKAIQALVERKAELIAEVYRLEGEVNQLQVEIDEEALRLLAATTPDVCVLDVNLGAGTSLAVADELDRRKIPFLFATGLLSMLFVPGFRRLGDLAAGTLVIQDEVVADPSTPRLLEPESSPVPLLPLEQRALMDLAERSDDISLERLEELGDIASPYTGLRGKASVQRLRAIASGLLK
ncbi:MAG TPA: PhoU domain-containing protein, partial [Fibrobacteria bacterium]|nr:PhoU domain-containing protein [Fibrobacteria bacterium]